MTVEECKARMSHAEYIRWQAYYLMEPYGVLQEKLGIAYLLSMIANMFRKEGVSPYSAEDFFPELGDGKKKKMDWYAPENQVLLARMWAQKNGGKIIEGKVDG